MAMMNPQFCAVCPVNEAAVAAGTFATGFGNSVIASSLFLRQPSV